MNKAKVMIVDDHRVFIEALAMLLDTSPEVEIVHTANNGLQAYNYVKRNPNKLDVVLMDIDMPEMNGLVAAEKILAEDPAMKIIMLTGHKEGVYVSKMLEVGAMGYVLKDCGGTELLKAIDQVSDHGTYYDKVAMHNYMDHMQTEKKKIKEGTLIQITERESEILHRIVDGLKSRQIAEEENIEASTVEVHRKSLLKKFRVPNVASLVREAILGGFVDISRWTNPNPMH